jgi:Lhr-like helicase
MSSIQLTIFKCKHCGLAIPSGRSDKSYCSNSCKQKNYRWRRKMERYASDMKRAASNLAAYLEYPDTRSDAIKYLANQRAYIGEVAKQYNVIIKAAQ